MKITKEMGRACLRAVPWDCRGEPVRNALFAIGWLSTTGHFFDTGDGQWWGMDSAQVSTALAMCAAIAGVKPE